MAIDSEGIPVINKRSSAFDWRDAARLVLFSLALFLGLFASLTFQFLPGRYQLNDGDVSSLDIRSPAKVTFVSVSKTNEERDRAAATVSDLYTFDPSIGSNQHQKQLDVLSRINEIRLRNVSESAKRDAIKAIPGLSLSDAVIGTILIMPDADWRTVNDEANRVLDTVMRGRISYRSLNDTYATIPSIINSQLSASLSQVGFEIVRSHIQPNYILDSQATENERQKARDNVLPVHYTLEKGEMIVRDGDIVRPFQLEALEAAGLRNPSVNWQDLLGAALLVGVVVGILSLYLYVYRPSIIAAPKRLLLIALVIVVAVLAFKILFPGREIFVYVFPVAAVAMLLGTLLDAELALMPAIVVAVLIGYISNSSLEFATMALVGGVVGMIGARRTERLDTFFITGLEIAVVNMIVILGFHLSIGDLNYIRVAQLAVISIANGLLCAVLTIGSYTVLGHIFGITTSLGLLELAHPTQPLFRRLLIEAPGTYHHSVVVANLAERAAQAVGADVLLARVGSYYHDIGKIMHPYFFIENQLDGFNVHDRLDPVTSGHSIAAHVADGLSLGRRHGLPGKVLDIIEQHHGTSLVRYFYHQACQENGSSVSPADFSYAGPKPQSREAAIVMLGDSVEAMVRASRDHSADQLDVMVNKVIADKIAEGQLSECDLTMRDLETIKKAFVAVLQGIFHPRITYPENTILPGDNSQDGQDNIQKGRSAEDAGETRIPRTGLG